MILTGDRNIVAGPSLATTPLSKVNPGLFALGTNSNPGVRWSDADLHQGQGNLGLADGSVQGVSSSKLREQLAQTGDTSHTGYGNALGTQGTGINRFQFPYVP